MRVTRTISAMSTLTGVRTTTTPAIPMGSPRILETVCGSIKFVIVCKLGLDLVAFLMTGENNIRYFRRRMYAVVPAAWHTKNTFLILASGRFLHGLTYFTGLCDIF